MPSGRQRSQQTQQGTSQPPLSQQEMSRLGQSPSQPSPSTPVSASPSSVDGGGTVMTQYTLPPEVASVHEIILTMKTALGALGTTFDAMGAQTAQMAVLGSELEIAQQLNSLRSMMKQQDQKQEKSIAEIQDLLNELMQVQIMRHLQQEVEAEIEAEIEETMKGQVAKKLDQYIPKALQGELVTHKQQLDDVHQQLHNSESRRANAELRSSDTDSTLHTIYQPNGKISERFPKNLMSLFTLDVEASKQLLSDYGQAAADISDPRESNLNRFIQFCGVSYQVVPSNQEDDVTYRSPTAVRHEYGRFRFGAIGGAALGGS